MPSKKKKFKENLLEAAVEIILTAVLFGIGYLVFCLFNIETDDFDLTVLVGIAAIAAAAAIAVICTKLFKKKKKESEIKKDERQQ